MNSDRTVPHGICLVNFITLAGILVASDLFNMVLDFFMELKNITSFKHSKLPMIYLGCPIYSGIDTCKPKLSINMAKWQKPNTNLFKLNVDGCSKGTLEKDGEVES
ncbi:hypothetical protein HAX54_023931 [Datura stramonium]|uniref:Uncharacterized protein n=1 Tax=Datura stramonium TaxID=4076 RepID=A0ABS8UX69_DATST|nr:hypothetical protein [Datura stramonium]